MDLQSSPKLTSCTSVSHATSSLCNTDIKFLQETETLGPSYCIRKPVGNPSNKNSASTWQIASAYPPLKFFFFLQIPINLVWGRVPWRKGRMLPGCRGGWKLPKYGLGGLAPVEWSVTVKLWLLGAALYPLYKHAHNYTASVYKNL